MRRLLLGLLALIALYALAVAWSTFTAPRSPVTTVEVVPDGEQDVILRLVRAATAAIAHRAEHDGVYRRDAHPVPHGCVRAHFRVRDDLEQALRYGVYATPGREYRAWVRFSSALEEDDRKPDGRGMAIKLLGVTSPDPSRARRSGSQDFLMVSGPAFFNRDVFEYEEFFHYQSQGSDQQILYFVKWNPFRWRLREMWIALALTRQRVDSPLAARYFSGLPFKLGPHNVKFSAKPCQPLALERPDHPGPHFLREAMVAHLSQRSACFEFGVQRQDPSRYMPIEDPTVLWREEDSPFVPVADIEIPRQDFDTDAQNQFCEQLSFAPWQGLDEHRPIGGLNRARRTVYEAVSVRRHAHNGALRGEPSGWCLDLSGAPCPEPDDGAPPGASGAEEG